MPYKIKLLDMCYPEYFRGFDGICISVAVTCKDTISDVLNSLSAQINHPPNKNVAIFCKLEPALKNFIKENSPRKHEIAFSIAPDENEEEVAYAYFGLVKIEED